MIIEIEKDDKFQKKFQNCAKISSILLISSICFRPLRLMAYQPSWIIYCQMNPLYHFVNNSQPGELEESYLFQGY